MSRLLSGRIAASFFIAYVAANSVAAQQVGGSTVLGALTGSRAPERPRGVALYGTDLGWTFEHNGTLQVMLGDSWASSDALCSVLTQGFPDQDDAQGDSGRSWFCRQGGD